MAHFKYKARDNQGKTVQGILEAANSSAVADILMKKSMMPMSIAETEIKEEADKEFSLDFLFARPVTLDDLIIFARQMYSLMKAGIPIIRAIMGLADTTTNPSFKAALEDVANQLEQGRNLSSALATHPNIFNRLMVSVVVVGENTGKLEDAFAQLAVYFEREQETRKRIKSAMRYPTFVVFALVAALFIMNIFVIPTFADMFAKFDAELPLMTRILISSSNFFVNYWLHMILAMVAIFFGVKHYLNTDQGRFKWDRYKLRIPVIGSIIERSLLSRFSRSFAMILRSGVPMTTGLTLVSEAVDNAYVEDRVIEMRKGIERGESLLRVSRTSGLFTQLVLQMIAVGEETGRVDELLQEAAEYYEREVDFDLKSLTSKIEPILISIVAGMVLVLALGIFTPMWDMMSAVKG